jgi:hypothetical protein
VTGKTSRSFWECFGVLPVAIQATAREKYRLWRRDHFHPSLHFKLVGERLWSVRINRDYRALGRQKDQLIVWFWIGTHQEYDKLL